MVNQVSKWCDCKIFCSLDSKMWTVQREMLNSELRLTYRANWWWFTWKKMWVSKPGVSKLYSVNYWGITMIQTFFITLEPTTGITARRWFDVQESQDSCHSELQCWLILWGQLHHRIIVAQRRANQSHWATSACWHILTGRQHFLEILTIFKILIFHS